MSVEIQENSLSGETENHILAQQKQSSGTLYSSLDVIPDAVFLIDYETLRITYVNRSAVTMTGYSRNELLQMGPYDLDRQMKRSAFKQIYDKLLEEGEPVLPATVRINHKSGRQIPVEVQRGIHRTGDEIVIIAILRDISFRLETEEQLKQLLRERTETLNRTSESLQKMENVMRWSIDGITITEADGTIIQVNQAFCDVTGYPEEEVIGMNPRILQSGRHSDSFYREMWESLNEHGSWSGEIWNRRKNGEAYPESLSINAIYDIDGSVSNYIAIFHDLSEIKKKEEEVRYSRQVDPLTGLHSRRSFLYRLESALIDASRLQTSVAVAILHIEDLRRVNEMHGHVVGDSLLQAVAGHLKNTFGSDSIVARTDGSEFGILTKNIATDSEYLALRKMLTSVFSQEKLPEVTKLRTTIHGGMVLFPRDAETASLMLRNADLALKEARKHPRTDDLLYVDLYSHALNRELQERIRVEESLEKALREHRIVPFYQPRIDLTRNRIVGFEALARWVEEDGTVVSPAQFIPLAEENGSILNIGRAIRNRIVDDFRSVNAPKQEFTISFNVSVSELEDTAFVDHMEHLMERASSLPISLEVEITESNLMSRSEEKLALLESLRKLGYRLAIDDFGTGYSSLAYLKCLPIDFLKIDQSFVRNIDSNPSDQTIVEAVTGMSRSFGLMTVAEGIETAEQQESLLERGCTEGQGYLYGRPMPFADLVKRYSV